MLIFEVVLVCNRFLMRNLGLKKTPNVDSIKAVLPQKLAIAFMAHLQTTCYSFIKFYSEELYERWFTQFVVFLIEFCQCKH